MTIILNKTFLKKNINNFHLLEISSPTYSQFGFLIKKYYQGFFKKIYEKYTSPEIFILDYIKKRNKLIKSIFLLDSFETDDKDILQFIVQSNNVNLNDINLPKIDIHDLNDRMVGNLKYLEISNVYTLNYNRYHDTIIYGNDFDLMTMEEFIQILENNP